MVVGNPSSRRLLMSCEARFLTGIGNATQRQRDHRVGSALVDEPALAHLFRVLRSPTLGWPRLASFSQPPVGRKSTITASRNSSYDFHGPPAIGFVWQKLRRHEGARRIAAACAERSQSWQHGSEAGAAMQNEANWGRVLSFKFEVPSGWAGANVQNEADFLDGWNDAKRQPKNELW